MREVSERVFVGFFALVSILLISTPAMALSGFERGEAIGSGLAILLCWIVGIIFLVRYFARKRREAKDAKMSSAVKAEPLAEDTILPPEHERRNGTE